MYTYLFKNDSVRTTPVEIRAALTEMYNQIMLYGNTIVLSYNQVTDSRAFLSGIYSDDSYEAIMNLIRHGKIKMNRYFSAKTPSEYMQNAIAQYLNHDNPGSFQFSGLPIETKESQLEENKMRLMDVADALRCSDPWLLMKKSKQYAAKGDEREAKRYRMFEHYVQMILLFSMKEDAYIAEKNPEEMGRTNRSLLDFLLLLLKDFETEDCGFTAISAEDRLESCKLIRDYIKQNQRTPKILCGRSNWYHHLRNLWDGAADENKVNCRKAIAFAEAMIDICYNFTIEESISIVLDHDIEAELLVAMQTELELYWQDIVSGAHIPFCDEERYVEAMEQSFLDAIEKTDVFRDFRKADIVISDNIHQKKPQKKQIKESHYEVLEGEHSENMRRQQKRWIGGILKGIFWNIGIAVFYIVVFVLINKMMGLAQSLFEDMFQRFAQLSIEIVSIIVFGIVNSVIAGCTHVPDILDSIERIACSIRDLHYILQAKRAAKKSEG